MSGCGCEDNVQQLQDRQSRTLVAILLINAGHVFVEAGTGLHIFYGVLSRSIVQLRISDRESRAM